MELLSLHAFDAVYQDVVNDLLRHWTPEMQEELAVHCRGWSSGSFDFERYLRNSSIRFHTAYLSCCADASTVCDIGGFWGVFPITLRRLGFAVTMTESLQYYGGAFDPLFGHIADAGVEIIDYDPFVEPPMPGSRFDVVTVMAVFEHYPHSLKWFMEGVTSIMEPDGMIYIEVPNVAYLPKKISYLLGRTPYAPIRDIYDSSVPFIGHHHEFTIDELRELAGLSGLTVIEEHFYNYFRLNLSDGASMLRHPLEALLFTLLKGSRECLGIACRRNHLLRAMRREEEERLHRRRVADGEMRERGGAILVGVS